jgi:hypothetical protein
LPSGFDQYVKVLDFVWEDTAVADFWTSRDELAESKELSYDVVLPDLVPGLHDKSTCPYDSPRVRQTCRRDMATRFGLAMCPEFAPPSFYRRTNDGGLWPARILIAKEGTLSQPALLKLLERLWQFTLEGEIYFCWDYLRMIANNPVSPVEDFTLAGPVGTLPVNWPDRVDYMPEYMWPEDRSWIVHMDYDLDFALLAGASPLATSVLESGELEALPVSKQTRIDNRADRINRK